ncbi:MAG: histidine kinase dimerization/phospho-acceptor domain-containing protein [Luteolibacter sp.]
MVPENNDPIPISVSHELKSPLTGIQMTLHLLKEEKIGPLNEKQAMMIKQAMLDCDRLVEAINRYVSHERRD